jgi:hypothetical protein
VARATRTAGAAAAFVSTELPLATNASQMGALGGKSPRCG